MELSVLSSFPSLKRHAPPRTGVPEPAPKRQRTKEPAKSSEDMVSTPISKDVVRQDKKTLKERREIEQLKEEQREYWEDILSQTKFMGHTEDFLAPLLTELEWAKETFSVGGKLFVSTQQVAWCGDEGVRFTWREERTAKDWNSILRKFNRKKEDIFTPFNFVYCIRLNNGYDALSWGPLLFGEGKQVVIITLGSNRVIDFREEAKSKIMVTSKVHEQYCTRFIAKNGTMVTIRKSRTEFSVPSCPKVTKGKSAATADPPVKRKRGRPPKNKI